MAEGENQQTPNQTPSGGGPDGSGGGPPARPEHIPEKFWDAAKGAPLVDDLARAYGDLSARFAKGKEALIPEIKSQLEAERLKARPATPDGYALKMPESGPLAERLKKSGLVLLEKPPAAGEKLPEGKLAFVFDAKNPMLPFWRKFAYDAGLNQDQFYEGAVTFAEYLASTRAEAMKKYADDLAAEHAKLGEHGPKRIEYLTGKLKALLGEEAAAAIEVGGLRAAGVEGLEKLIELAGEPKFSPGQADPAGGAAAAELRMEADKLIGSPDYYQDPAKQARVAAIFKKLHPGQVQTAALNPGENTRAFGG